MTVKTIGTAGGRDYSTWAAWIADVPADLVAISDTWIGEGYNDSEFTITSSIDIKGTVTNSSYYVEMRAATGQSWSANAPLRYDSSQGVAIRRTSGAFECVEISQDYTKITGLQFKTDVTSGGGPIVCKAANITIDRCLLESQATSGAYCIDALGNGPLTLRNCAFIGRVDLLKNFQQSGDVMEFCTLVHTGTVGGSAVTNSFAASDAFTIKNCAFFNFGDIATNSDGCTGNNNATDLPSIGFGTSNVINLTATDEIFSITEGSEDLRSKGNNLAGAGVAISGITTDFRGTTRPDPPSIGCWEGDRTLTADAGSYTITGYDVQFFVNTLVAEKGSYTMSFGTANPHVKNVIGDAGSYTITGYEVIFVDPNASSLHRRPDNREDWQRISRRYAKLTGRMKRSLR